ncbi:LCP family protein [Veillonella sp.]|jgi:LCP family protein required for cell wall assembly|uniref:LCP family protein n=1 Tax=Veillonella sp. TaxID=1926307 RepID=UPI001B56B55F|nr:LCP family protein [Veillonella sp.]MBP8616588.1 LCP family protein [Veillonella sp.]
MAQDENKSALRKRRKKRTKQSGVKWGRLIFVILLLIAVVGGVVYGVSQAVSYVQTSLSSSSTSADTSATMSDENQPRTTVPTVSVEQQAVDKPIYVLVVGKDTNNPAQSDSLFLMAINEEQKTMDIIGIPSNSKIESRNQKSVDMLNTMYSQGGIELTKAVVEDIFRISIPYYIVVDEAAFKKTNDVYGNRDMYVEQNMSHVDSATGKEDISLRRGFQTLNSENALGYLRYSDDNNDTFTRVQRQERFLKLLLDQSLSSFTVTNSYHIWRVWDEYESNISTYDAISLMMKIGRMAQENIHFYILPGEKESIDGKIYWNINPTESQRLVGIMMGDLPADDANGNLTKTPTVSEPTTSTVKSEDSKSEERTTSTSTPKEPGETESDTTSNTPSKSNSTKE